jgi:hypothetical protein
MSKRMMVIPDTQVRPNDDLEYLERIGKYAVDMLPDIIVMLGDFADMPSLSSHDKAGSKSMEGQRYKADIKVVHEAMDKLLTPIREEQQRRIDNHKPRWNPRMVMLYGNHENRINRAIDNDPKLDGLISLEDLKYEEAGWETVPFLQPIIIAYGLRADGSEVMALITGSCYEHEEHYLNHQTNRHFRGLYMLFDVKDGMFDECPISLRYLRKRYKE